jgi:hypothetical protein
LLSSVSFRPSLPDFSVPAHLTSREIHWADACFGWSELRSRSCVHGILNSSSVSPVK